MRRWLFAATSVAALAISMAMAGAATDEARPLPQNGTAAQTPNGAAVYRDHCASCHDHPVDRTPALDALKERTAEAILASMDGGSMSVQAQMLSAADKRAVADFLAAKPQSPSSAARVPGLCPTRPSSLADPASKPAWSGWGNDLANSRFQPKPGMTAADVPALTLKWAFGFPGGSQAYGHPAIAAGRVFAGSDSGVVYSLDAETGCTYWSFAAEGGVRTAVSIGAVSRSGRSLYAAYFGDLKANVYAVDAATGDLIWKLKVDDHPFARITGAPVFHAGRLYVPVSSAADPHSMPPSAPPLPALKLHSTLPSLSGSSPHTLPDFWPMTMIRLPPGRVRRIGALPKS